MARIRTVKPEFWTNEKVVSCSLNARLLFIGLWNFSDDDGRCVDSPRSIKMKIFPGDDFTAADVHGMLTELSRNALLQRYEVDGKQFIQITGWAHQKISHHNPSKLPPPDEADSVNAPGLFSEGDPPEGKGRDIEGKRKTPSESKEKPPKREGSVKSSEPASRGTRLPEAWTPSDNGDFGIGLGFNLDEIQAELDKFRDYFHAQPGTKGVKLDWPATFRNWLRRTAESPSTATKLARRNGSSQAPPGPRI